MPMLLDMSARLIAALGSPVVFAIAMLAGWLLARVTF